MWFSPALLTLAFLTGVLAKGGGDCEAKLAACQERRPGRPVCGTDNRTYPTRCHLLMASCHSTGQRLTVKHRGKCPEKQACWSSGGSSLGGQGSVGFVPKCLPDGSYAPVQCHQPTGFCWCVTPSGTPVPNSYVRKVKPVCNRKGKARRGSAIRNRKQRKDCGRIERSNFINNLVKTFRIEYTRAENISSNSSDEDLDKTASEWMFTTLDLDKNDTLTRSEYKDIRKLVKKVVKPKKCARAFIRICDFDRDMSISHEEWTACLKVQFHPARSDGEKIISNGQLGGLQEIPARLGGQNIGSIREITERPDETEAINCLSDRKNVLEEKKLSNSELYVPECTPDGRYKQIQCYESTGYCWCVHEDTGKPIPGTTVKHLNPKCDVAPSPPRPMKGCPEAKKQAFLVDLMDFLRKRMTSQKTKDAPNTLLESQTEDYLTATWSFMDLDVNKNKALDRKEWKTFRTMISAERKLRRCGKKLPRYCDVNYDRKISVTEWLHCLDTQRTTIPSSSSQNTRKPRFGPMDVLKED